MKDNWIKKLKANQEGFERQEPDKLWEDINKSLGNKRRVAFLPKLAFYAAGIAAIILIGLFLYKNFSYKDIPKNVVVKDTSIKNNNVIVKDTVVKEIESKEVMKFVRVVRKDEIVGEEIIGGDDERDVYREEKCVEDVDKEIVIKKNEVVDDFVWKDEAVKKKRGKTKFSVGLYAANFSSDLMKDNVPGNVVRMYLSSDVTPSSIVGKREDSEVWLGAQNGETQTDIEHKLPIREGISFRLMLDKRFSVNSGVFYSRLISTIKSGSINSNYRTEQVLNYVGIPLSVDYNLWQENNFNFYLSAGGAVEKCIYGEQKQIYTIMGYKGDTQRLKLDDKRLQFSINGAVGFEYNFLKYLGIYVEPGVSYFFNNGSNIKNIYKEKPVNFSLEIGVRVNF